MAEGAPLTGAAHDVAHEARPGAVERAEAHAETMERFADEAERYADMLEKAAVNGYSERRLDLARRERDIAAINRRNAALVRSEGHGGAPGAYPGLTSAHGRHDPPSVPDEATSAHPGLEALSRQRERIIGDLAVTTDAMATLVEEVADGAEAFAELLEGMTARGDTEHRLALARRERELAAIARRNAERLRQPHHGGTPFEHYPHLNAAQTGL